MVTIPIQGASLLEETLNFKALMRIDMKNKIILTLFTAAILVASCKKDFTERPALDTPTVDNYYNTAEQVKGATGTLYGLPWFDYIDKALDCIGEVRAG